MWANNECIITNKIWPDINSDCRRQWVLMQVWWCWCWRQQQQSSGWVFTLGWHLMCWTERVLVVQLEWLEHFMSVCLQVSLAALWHYKVQNAKKRLKNVKRYRWKNWIKTVEDVDRMFLQLTTTDDDTLTFKQRKMVIMNNEGITKQRMLYLLTSHVEKTRCWSSTYRYGNIVKLLVHVLKYYDQNLLAYMWM